MALIAVGHADQTTLIPEETKVFVERIGGFETDLVAALMAERVPLAIVVDRKDADFVIAADGRRARTIRSAQTPSKKRR